MIIKYWKDIFNFLWQEIIHLFAARANEVDFGQIVKAFMVPKDEYKDTLTKEDVLTYSKDRLPFTNFQEK